MKSEQSVILLDSLMQTVLFKASKDFFDASDYISYEFDVFTYTSFQIWNFFASYSLLVVFCSHFSSSGRLFKAPGNEVSAKVRLMRI